MKRRFTAAFTLSVALAVGALGIAPVAATGDPEGCTPGYWKQSQHFGNWPAPYTPSTPFANVHFEDAFPGMTLLEVLRLRGGGLKALGRHAVAGLLNSAALTHYTAVGPITTPSEAVRLFNRAFPGRKSRLNAAKYIFERANQAGCPLGRAE